MSPRPSAIGRYEIVSEIARGGMGTLYVAFDPRLDRQIAIKLLNENNAELRERFAREARSAARLRHPHIVTIFDVGEDEGRPYIAMEYLQGQTFADLIQRRAPLTERRKLELIEQLADGLAFAHRAGIIHRDVKPANVMVDVNGLVKILDFGIARRLGDPGSTVAGGLIGSLNYMSPEQVSGKPVDRRSDIFAVGSVMYELFTNRQAFPGNIDAGVLPRLLFSEPDPLESLCPDLDPDVARIVERCLQKNPERRYPDLGAMIKELQRIRNRLPGPDDSTTNIKNWSSPAPQAVPNAPTTPMSRQWAQREALSRRRATEIQVYLETAEAALQSGDFEKAIASCEEVLIRDAEEARALELIDRAKSVMDQRQAAEWLTEAEVELRRGALTAALALIERAEILNPSSARAIELRRAADDVLRERERLRRRAEAVRQALDRGLVAYDKGQYPEAVAAGQEALALDPASIEAKTLTERAAEAVAARERAELERRARETVREARRMFESGSHASALDLLARFEPRHNLVTQAEERFRMEAGRIAEERRQEAERLAKQKRLAAELESIRREIDREDYLDALQHLDALIRAEGAMPEIQALRQQAQAAQAEADRREALAHDLAEHVARAAGLFARNDLAGAASRVDAALKLNPSHAPALTLQAKIQERLRLAAEQRQNEERRERERGLAVADALERARRAPSNELAVAALAEALDLEPGHAEARSLLEQRRAAIEREKGEQRRYLEAEQARRRQLQQLVAGARQALSAGDLEEARRSARSAAELDPRDAETQLILHELALSTPLPRRADPGDLTLIRPAPPPPVQAKSTKPDPPKSETRRDQPVGSNRPLASAPAPVPPRVSPPVTPRPKPSSRRPSIRTLVGGSLTLVAGLGVIAFLLFRHPEPGERTASAPADSSRGVERVEPTPVTKTSVDPLESQLAAIRQQARDQLTGGDWRRFLSVVAAGLKLRADDPDLKRLLETARSDAGQRLGQQRAAASQAGREALRSPDFGAAVRKERESNQLGRAGKIEDSIRASNEAADLFQLAGAAAKTAQAAQAQAAQKSTSTVPPAAVAPATSSVAPSSTSTSVPLPTTLVVDTPPIRLPPTVPPTTTTISLPTPPPPQAQEPLIQAVLEAFAVGYSRLDVDAVKRVYPSLNERDLKRAFDDLRSQRMRIQTDRISVAGNTATAVVTLITAVDSRVAGQKSNTRQVMFQLQKRNETWVITSER